MVLAEARPGGWVAGDAGEPGFGITGEVWAVATAGEGDGGDGDVDGRPGRGEFWGAAAKSRERYIAWFRYGDAILLPPEEWTTMIADKQHAHALVDRIPADQMTAAVRFLEFLLLEPVDRALATAPVEDEEISAEEEQAVAGSKEWFKHNEGIPFDQVVTDLGFTTEQIRSHRPDKEQDPAA